MHILHQPAAERQTETYIESADRQTGTDKQTDGHTDRQANRQTDRQLLQTFQEQQSELPLKHIQSKIHCQDEFPIFAKKSPKSWAFCWHVLPCITFALYYQLQNKMVNSS